MVNKIQNPNAETRKKEISKRIRKTLPEEIMRLVELIAEIAERDSCDIFLVGGFVRDMLLGVKNLDLDFVVEGDASKIAEALVKKAGGEFVAHKKFGTATAVIPWRVRSKGVKLDNVKIDLAAARREAYERPAALPTVEFSDVREDLFRRDFTINAMAVSLKKDNIGRLIDFFGGQKDLANKKIKVLHDASFLDDPTRIFRAVRFEQRLGFKIEPHTESLIKEALGRKMLHRTEEQRLRDELILILKEKEPGSMLRRMDELDELRFISPGLRFTKKTGEFFDSVKKTVSWFESAHTGKRKLDVWLIYLMALLDGLGAPEIEQVCERFVFRRGERIRLISYAKDGPRILRAMNKKGHVPPSEIFRLLEPLSYEVILAALARSASKGAKRISDFFKKYNGIQLKIKGGDLKSLGIKAGPDFKKIFSAALCAKLDRDLKTRSQELAFVKKFMGRR